MPCKLHRVWLFYATTLLRCIVNYGFMRAEIDLACRDARHTTTHDIINVELARDVAREGALKMTQTNRLDGGLVLDQRLFRLNLMVSG